MGGGLEENELRQTIAKLADELADAHALMTTQQRKRAFGKHVFNAKQLAYGPLHQLHAAQAARQPLPTRRRYRGTARGVY